VHSFISSRHPSDISACYNSFIHDNCIVQDHVLWCVYTQNDTISSRQILTKPRTLVDTARHQKC